MAKQKLGYSHISCKSAGVGKAAISDPPVSQALLSLQWLGDQVFPITEWKV
jgi:hypothetical protein